MTALCVINKHFQEFIDSKFTLDYDHDSLMTMKCFADHTGIEVDTFRDTLIQLLNNVKNLIDENAHHISKNGEEAKACMAQLSDAIRDSVNALDVGSYIVMCNGSTTDNIDSASCSVTHTYVDADFRPDYEQMSGSEVPLIVKHNVLVNEH